jgi:hypothetical protein
MHHFSWTSCTSRPAKFSRDQFQRFLFFAARENQNSAVSLVEQVQAPLIWLLAMDEVMA